MKKIFFAFLTFFFFIITVKAAENTMFGSAENQIAFYGAVGTGGSKLDHLFGVQWEIVPFTYWAVQYSQPITFFRLPARQTFSLGTTVGLGEYDGEDWRKYSWPMFSITMDIAPITIGKFYMGIGVGPAIKSKSDARQDSKFVFDTKAFIGYRFTDSFGAEFRTEHFSNGSLTPINKAYNFAGLAVFMNF